MAKWVLEAIEITGGFLPGLSLKLPQGLTCIIGPRGSGKSTLIEALRYSVGGVSGASKARADLIQANLGSAIVTMQTTHDKQGVAYLIRRSYRQPPALSTTDGKTITGVDLDRGTFLPIDGYSSAEIEAIADESLGEKRRALLDELRGDELHAIFLSIADQRRTLEANADTIRATERLITDLTEQIEELGDARARLESFPQSTVDSAPGDLVRASRQQQVNAHEAKSIAIVITLLFRYRSELCQLQQKYRAGLKQELEVKESTNAAFMRHGVASVETVLRAVDDRITATTDELEHAEEALRRVESALQDAHASQQAEYVCFASKVCRFATKVCRLASKSQKWHMARLLGVLYRPWQKVHTILCICYRAAGRLPKQSLCQKGLPELSERFAARTKVQRFFTPKHVRRVPPFSRQRFVANLRPTAMLSGNTRAPCR